MRLLDTRTLRLKTFAGKRRQKYAIFSHTWGEEEVVFEDVEQRPGGSANWREKKGFPKVQNACAKANVNGYDYIWIDNCCIDKSSSAELSEAINSMFTWYQQASVCYAYLADVEDLGQLPGASWFFRGWTLQELIAPNVVHFYNKGWEPLGSRLELSSTLESITTIDATILGRDRRESHTCFYDDRDDGYCVGCQQQRVHMDALLSERSVAKRMSWATRRETSRNEDLAYSLMGLFGVNMPLLYGEGFKRAFLRLQQEIIKVSRDQSILAWTGSSALGLLANHPRQFIPSVHEYLHDFGARAPQKPMSYNNGTLTLELLVCPVRSASGVLPERQQGEHSGSSIFAGFLDCTIGPDPYARPAIILNWESGNYWTPWDELYKTTSGSQRLEPLPGSSTRSRFEYSEEEARRAEVTLIPARSQSGEAEWPPIRLKPIIQPDPLTYQPFRCSPGFQLQSGSDVYLASTKPGQTGALFFRGAPLALGHAEPQLPPFFVAWGEQRGRKYYSVRGVRETAENMRIGGYDDDVNTTQIMRAVRGAVLSVPLQPWMPDTHSTTLDVAGFAAFSTVEVFVEMVAFTRLQRTTYELEVVITPGAQAGFHGGYAKSVCEMDDG